MNIYAKSGPEWTPLVEHLIHVCTAVEKVAIHLGMNIEVARNGAILHDIGKSHPVFQKRLRNKHRVYVDVFRHEIASLFFLSAFPREQWSELIEMAVSHHKSVKNDVNKLGLLDLEQLCDYEDFHLGNWDKWSEDAWKILLELGVSYKLITVREARENLLYCVKYCAKKNNTRGFSEWKGLLMAGDHLASALIDKTEENSMKLFTKPDLSFYNRTHSLYPLSQIKADSLRKHTIVVACTGAGKTDYLLRRCKGRVFYTLPFQASINAMFKRVGKDLEKDNPNLDIRVLHSTSKIIKGKNTDEEVVLQSQIGASVKILTPHQLSALAFGMKGYEALILDLKGCDVILDEVHTYTGVSQAIVLKLVEVLKRIGCKIHIGTATMPIILYKKIKELLGDDVLEIKLSPTELDKFDRHIIHKISSFYDSEALIKRAISKKKKVLIVLNKVKTAQDIFDYIKSKKEFENIPTMLLHSRFKRGDRNQKEKNLIGLDEDGKSLNVYNTSSDGCIVISTQIVEVSLDISFDIMITECAPLDALIQRFGRVNRVRNLQTIGKYMPVYVISPPDDEKNARPYDLEVLKKSYAQLDDGQVLHERDLQNKIDNIFTQIDFMSIEEHSVFKSNGEISIDCLSHNGKAILFDLLEIDSVACVTESDLYEYENSSFEQRLNLEIPTYYYSVSKKRQSDKGNRPFIVPDCAYCTEKGLLADKINSSTGVIL
ncbi:CRISPR-associated helicase Cas3' [Proteiniphilum propionicum]|jgi:CRISPR-associated endonuclease/helicase Cas3|uniref:CRISPR-associated helicase Cas3' n=1 Tax=Proteiniphilum propionicum TaxID=2829812 RepID=UPI001EEB7C04|nr:CRISPR-associated helicase Cas3' [Proteiniphilum propionicum]ULB35852.1 CRISPR-associated helicase Cas3' [Proteiniphilum propionicum]